MPEDITVLYEPQVSHVLYCGLLDYATVQSGRGVWMFQRNMLPVSLVQNVDVVCWYQKPEHHNTIFCCFADTLWYKGVKEIITGDKENKNNLYVRIRTQKLLHANIGDMKKSEQ